MSIDLVEIDKDRRASYLNLLLIGDEDEKVVKSYINEGSLFTIVYEKKEIGVVQCLIDEEESAVEVKNIGLEEAYRGKGIGSKVIKKLEALYECNQYSKMIVGTADSSLENIAFYKKAGFYQSGVKKNFFLQYVPPIYENGLQAIDMIMFEKKLKSRSD
ncbi:GNAT family N-acetyltransferase [Priestia sp. Y58]|uniref:GNAT family N-acetyltransferase n=1 Tax=Priestia TaxID=2800373 RepID=UPI001C8E5819|nr:MULTISPECIES: GNAT family N-acetyltransferase [Priestia]MBX9999289.1 GNAT family N-acetyltransferase [Priestia aryabhattai]MCZ8493406.1 GNAT family N-acetyltransferase [Priestia megaterium]MDG0030310.1 GNAT family N-acetyltransferase [Priestia sp. Y58]MDG0059651.1 GNAT family N-acetyltransferase [Priestia sp. P5]